MVNRFEKYVGAGGTGAPTKSNANRFEQYLPPPKPEEEEPSMLSRIGNFGLDTLRNFNDTASFGLYNRVLEGTGIQPDADELLAKADAENPYAGVLGDMMGYVLPGMGASAAVGKAVPKLAGNTVKQIMAREAIGSGAVSATDDFARTGTVDPWGVAVDTATGGLLAGGFAGAGRLVSPEARVRASGNGMSPEDSLMAEYYMRSAADEGVPLSVPEAVNAANPVSGVPVQRIFDDALQAPKGSQAAQVFEASRGPKIEAVGRDMVNKVGPGATPFETSAAADAALARTREMVSNSAQPYYDVADTRKLPPSWVPKDASIEAATRKLMADTEKMDFLRKKAGLPKGATVPRNSVLFQDAVKKQLSTMGAQADKADEGLLASLRFGAADDVTNAADRVAPEYGTARDITEQGSAMVGNLESGPLGKVGKQPTAKGQASTIFGVDNAVDADASRRALAFMGAEDAAVPQGILANQLDSAVSSNPSNWANTALPTPQAKQLGLDVMGDPMLAKRLEAASLVNPNAGAALPGHDGSWLAKAQAAVTNLGKGKVAKLMTEGGVGTIQKLGKTGPVQKVLTSAGIGGTQTTMKRRRKNARRLNA